jgi:RecA/RadA recombinase
MSIKDKLIKNSTIKDTATLAQSKIYGKKDMIRTNIPMINVALGGTIDGGLTPGLTMLAGPSKHFKTGFSLLMAKAYLDKYPDGAILFYDSEFGTPQDYFDSFGISSESVIHTPITDVEQLKFDVMKQMNELERGDKVLIIVDSVGNLASKKEVEDALNEKAVADMSRAKQLKSLFRMITPHLSLKDIPMVAVNHTYKEIGMFPKDIVSGGTGGYYSADTIWILGRQQDKDGQEIKGYHFIINVEKSRYVKEKAKVPISISWDGGINKWSGLLECALEHGSVVKPKVGWYQKAGGEKSYREKQLIADSEFWKDIFKTTDFAKFLEQKYKAVRKNNGMMQDDESEDLQD